MTTVGDMLVRHRTNRRVVVAVVSDTHANHRLGLLNPNTALYDEDEEGNLTAWHPALGPTQEALWSWYLEDIARAQALADGCPIILAHLGDIVHGGNGKPREFVSARLADQFEIAFANFGPWMSVANIERIILVKGTAYHELEEGSGALILAKTLRAAGKEVEVPYHWRAEIGGARFNLSHHGPPPGVRNWLRGNILRLYTQSLMDEALIEGEDPPDVMLRGHYHQYVPETVTRRARGKTWRTQAVICPSYCLIDDYARKVAKSPERATIGMIAFVIEDGRVSAPYEFMRTTDFTTKEVLYAS